MDAKEKNKIRCKEYYRKTKGTLSEEVKAKRREQCKIRQRRFYEKNKELCKMRVYEHRAKNQYIKEYLIDKIKGLNNLITEKEIQIIKSLNLTPIIKKAPRLKMWDKKINLWTFKDYKKLEALTNTNTVI